MWHIVATIEEIPEGFSLWFFENKQILVIRRSIIITTIDNSCPHAGASLANGTLSGKYIRCRAHGIKFDLTTGNSALGDGLSLAVYENRIREGKLEIKLT